MGNPVGFWIRFLAIILDSIVLGSLTWLLTRDWTGNTYTSILDFLYFTIVPVVWMGATIGKKLLGIQISRINGSRVGIGTMLLRNIAMILYVITFGIALLVSAFMIELRKDKRSIHDLIAGTYVTYVNR